MKTLLLVSALLLSLSSFAGANIPDCKGALNVSNEQVLQWKKSTANQYKARGHIEGTLEKAYKDQSGHKHWSVRIGEQASDRIEVIYNVSFGSLPAPYPGMKIEACGDYITSNKKTGNYPASPDGAIIHWVHASTSNKHPSGFLVIDGEVYGQDTTNAR